MRDVKELLTIIIKSKMSRPCNSHTMMQSIHIWLVGTLLLIKGRGVYPDQLMMATMGTGERRGSRDSPNMLCLSNTCFIG